MEPLLVEPLLEEQLPVVWELQDRIHSPVWVAWAAHMEEWVAWAACLQAAWVVWEACHQAA